MVKQLNSTIFATVKIHILDSGLVIQQSHANHLLY